MADPKPETDGKDVEKHPLTRAERNAARKAEKREAREARRADRKFRQQVRKARYNTQTVDSRGAEFRAKAMRFMLVITIFFIVVGIALIAMGIYGTTSRWANFFGKGPGFSVAAVGLVVILVALCGFYGAKKDNKFLLLFYFVVTCLTLIFLVVIGSIAVFDNTQIDSKFSKWWCKYAEEAREAQDEFNCCGYNCPVDRPAEGACPNNIGTGAPYGTVNSTCTAEISNVCSDSFTYAFKGCKQKALDYMRSRFVPLFLLAFATGIMMFFAVIVSGFFTCRSTVRHVQKERGIEVPENRPDAAAYEKLIIEASTAVDVKPGPLEGSETK